MIGFNQGQKWPIIHGCGGVLVVLASPQFPLNLQIIPNLEIDIANSELFLYYNFKEHPFPLSR